MFLPESFVGFLKISIFILFVLFLIRGIWRLFQNQDSSKPKHELNTGNKIPCFHMREDCEECMSQNHCNKKNENLLDEEEDL